MRYGLRWPWPQRHSQAVGYGFLYHCGFDGVFGNQEVHGLAVKMRTGSSLRLRLDLGAVP